jgi:alpha-L-arabinofuranosidase
VVLRGFLNYSDMVSRQSFRRPARKDTFSWIKKLTLPALALAALAAPTAWGATTIEIQADRPGAKISPAMWGIFFEDINFGADGGLYGEMVKNRSFEFPDPFMGWIKISPSLAHGDLFVRTDGSGNSNNTHYVTISSEGTAPFGISNEGFRGMGVRQGETYNFSAQIRSRGGSPVVRVQLYGGDGTLLDSAELQNFSFGWKKYTATLHPHDTDPKARLAVVLDGKGAIDIDMVSLFPEHTWKDRPGGLRADMVQALADLHPGFMRFPGGCIVEGSVLERRYQWKNTIGPVENRRVLIDRWNYEFQHRPTPDYFQSFGLGFFEYFQLCEDIGAEPLPSSIAAWPASSIPASSAPSRPSGHTSRMRSTWLNSPTAPPTRPGAQNARPSAIPRPST